MADETQNTMNYFRLGEDFEFKLDAQRRVSVPSDWRSENPGGIFMVIPGRDRTLQLYPDAAFNERIMSKLKKLSPGNSEDLRKLRMLGSQIVKCECDSQGRIQLPQKLLEYAGITGKIAMIGSGDFGQLMTPERWAAEKKANEVSGDAFLDILDL